MDSGPLHIDIFFLVFRDLLITHIGVAKTLYCQISKDVISFCVRPSELFLREIHLFIYLFPIFCVLDLDVEVRSLSDIKYVMSIISQMDQRQFITDCK